MSRTAVHELITAAVGHLEDYEAALGVVRMRTHAEAMKRRLEELGVKDAALARLFEEFDKTE